MSLVNAVTQGPGEAWRVPLNCYSFALGGSCCLSLCVCGLYWPSYSPMSPGPIDRESESGTKSCV